MSFNSPPLQKPVVVSRVHNVEIENEHVEYPHVHVSFQRGVVQLHPIQGSSEQLQKPKAEASAKRLLRTRPCDIIDIPFGPRQ